VVYGVLGAREQRGGEVNENNALICTFEKLFQPPVTSGKLNQRRKEAAYPRDTLKSLLEEVKEDRTQGLKHGEERS